MTNENQFNTLRTDEKLNGRNARALLSLGIQKQASSGA